MKRIYESLVADHFSNNQQMAFLSGPRQVGKTTTAKTCSNIRYYNWDNSDDRGLILQGYDALLHRDDLTSMVSPGTRIVLDEIHKFPKWKNFLKGLYDTYGKEYDILVTGSSRLTIYKRGSDSLMGRYFNYRMHPLSPAEAVRPGFNDKNTISEPAKIKTDLLDQLLTFGGFPEPFLKADTRFYNRWRSLRKDQLFKEDIRDLTSVNEISLLEILASLLESRSGNLINYSTLAGDLQVSVNTVKNWISVLESFHYCFRIKPWHKNVPKTLLKQPKIYLRDWSIISDRGSRAENFTACQLLKAVEFWTDSGFGTYDLFFLRDKNKREVDFLITENNRPWFMVEVKSSVSKEISSSLKYFSGLLGVNLAFQIAFDLPFIDRNCFDVKNPVKVPAATFFSQLV
jgi:hypothetical protein